MPRVLLIGLDAGDWELLNPLLDSGKLPAIQSLIEQGCSGRIATLAPCLSPCLWTSVATGRFPDEHGVLGFVECDADGLLSPASSHSRRLPALWNIASHCQKRSVVVGWYASHPVEPILGAMVSDLAVLPEWGTPDCVPTIPPLGVFPLSDEAAFEWMKVHPAEITTEDLATLIPRITEIDLSADSRPLHLAEILARDATVQAYATYRLSQENWDFAAVYFQGLDTAGHHFMPFHPPQMEQIDPVDFELYSGVMSNLAIFYDSMIARLLEIAGSETCVLIVSDHGFHCGEDRPLATAAECGLAEDAAQWHKPLGIFIASGPGIASDARIHGTTLLDIAPTVLRLLGLPVDRSMRGRIPGGLLTNESPQTCIDNWSETCGVEGRWPGRTPGSSDAAANCLLRIHKLGYSTGLDIAATIIAPEAIQKYSEKIFLEWEINRCASLQSRGQTELAIHLLQDLILRFPTSSRLCKALAHAYWNAERFNDCAQLLRQYNGWLSSDPDIQTLQCLLAFINSTFDEAFRQLVERIEVNPECLHVCSSIGEYLFRRGQQQASESVFQFRIQHGKPCFRSLSGLAAIRLTQAAFTDTVQLCRLSLGLRYFQPHVHLLLSVAQQQMGDHHAAIESARVAFRQQPEHPQIGPHLRKLLQSAGLWLEVAALDLNSEFATQPPNWPNQKMDQNMRPT
jgi:predicted AlkP superfamily phosphohydrolase/phosphomutase/tetratricopeptide (TPR) repeat protein